jgi:hypothetical protein
MRQTKTTFWLRGNADKKKMGKEEKKEGQREGKEREQAKKEGKKT